MDVIIKRKHCNLNQIKFIIDKIKKYDRVKKRTIRSCEFYDKENNKSKVPEGESIKINCLWLIEIYTPDTINKLISNLKKLNWNRSFFSSYKDNLSQIIRQVRENDSHSWHNFGYIMPRNVKSLFESKTSDLPAGIDCIKLSMTHSTASTTILIFKFILSNDSRSMYENLLNKQYSTYTKKINNGFMYITPFKQKSEAIKNSRNELTQKCKRWIQKNLGGFYTSNNLLAEMPIYDFLTIENTKLFSINKKTLFDYKHILNLDSSDNIWRINDIPGLFLRFKSSMNDSPSYVSLVGDCKEILKGKDLSDYGSDKNTQIVNYLDYFDQTLVVFALFNLHHTYKTQISKIRDKISNIELSNIKKASVSFLEISKEFAKVDGNITYFSNELKNLCKYKDIFLHNIYSMTTYDIEFFDREELTNSIRKSLISNSVILEKTHNNLRSVFNTTSQIINSLSNEKLSRRNIWLQTFMAILTLAMLLLTCVSLYNNDNIQDIIKSTNMINKFPF